MPTTTALKNHISGFVRVTRVLFFLIRVLFFLIRVLFFLAWILWAESDGCFFMKLNKYWKHFCYYVLVARRTLKRFFHVLILAVTPCRCLARCIPTCRYYIYYCSLPLASASPSSLLNPFSASCIFKFSQPEPILLIEQTWENLTFNLQ